ncbi:MAG: Rieske (2Fe-2S) protein [Chitinophagaceae bacterium]|nr:Rieske (2Fe-2S) protein [Chitinophagaceae bacterium]
MKRRNFIKKGCAACAGLAGLSFLLESCGSSLPIFKTTPEKKLLFIPEDKFTADNHHLLVRSKELENDILLIKNKNDYTALNMKCTHEGFALTVTDKQIVCPAHGSTFHFSGHVTKEPALRPLTTFTTEIKNNTIIIHLP